MNGRGDRIKPLTRRASWTYTIETRGNRALKAHVTLGMYPSGKVSEIFVVIGKNGSDLRTTYEAWAMSASKALQCGTPLRVVASALRGTKDGTCHTAIDEEDNAAECGSMWDAIAQLLERHDF